MIEVFKYMNKKYNVDDLEMLPRYTAVGMQTRGHSIKMKKRSCNGFRWSMHGIGCQKILMPQHQSTVSKDIILDLFASHQKKTTHSINERSKGIITYRDMYQMMMMIR